MSHTSWENFPWKQLSFVNDEEVISLSHAKVFVFSDSVVRLGKVNQNTTSNCVWEEQLSWFKDSPQYRTLETIDGEPMEFEWNVFPGFTTLQLVQEVQEFMTKMGDPAQFQGRIIFMSMFFDIIWGSEADERKCIANATLVTLFAQRFPPGRWSYFTYNERPRGEWDRVAELMMIKFRESGHPVFRATSPLSRGDGDTIETVSHNYFCTQLSINGAVSDLCDEYSACQARTVRPVLAGQSDDC